jgi:hypothetical protein
VYLVTVRLHADTAACADAAKAGDALTVNLRALASPADGLQYVYAELRPPNDGLALFLLQDSAASAESAALRLVTAALAATPGLTRRTVRTCHVDLIPALADELLD